MSMKSKLLQWLQWSAVRGKLAGRLMCIYFLLIVLPLGMFSFYAYMRVRDNTCGAFLYTFPASDT